MTQELYIGVVCSAKWCLLVHDVSVCMYYLTLVSDELYQLRLQCHASSKVHFAMRFVCVCVHAHAQRCVCAGIGRADTVREARVHELSEE